ncbi:capsular polysaccharide export protein, LipB/KpsS family [Phaeovulum vinaykumarii]|uniref:Capsule polysaccharide biosynthesis protein n=1 Tax=Phaeovulum vinaykumarii TaxID=407234 RepID=A0A1N7LG27_9RHOB|nr:hypothetical protein [Phaeovulum vinaykumarii]SIS72744.1 Capsule polysaccharide biosynthesis protein [Phaeovulum vinaykumarii]SOC04495.1 capsular polysaccharide biosynthesis protein [Phaeovulum vinaykumarii]
MRLAVVSTAENTNRVLAALQRQAGDRVEVVLHFGGTKDDIKASALNRMDARAGRMGHLFAAQRFTGAAQVLMDSPEFQASFEDFADQIQRQGAGNAYRSHPLRSLQDYADYYHILADVIGQTLIERQVTHCLFFNVPHLTYDTVLFQVARAMGLGVTIVSQSLFPNRIFSLTDPADLGDFPADPTAAPYPIERGSRPDLFYMKGIKQEREAGGHLSARALVQLLAYLALKRPGLVLRPLHLWRLLRDMRRVYGGLPKWRDPFARFFHEDALAYFEHLAGLEDQVLDLSGEYVYFPLQLQPEMTTSALGGRFRDQAHAIETLAAILPEGVRILVKENPKQGAFMRGPLFFHRLRRIPSVTFLPSWADTHALTGNARFVASITGTVGWEAIRMGKPALVFGKAWYRNLPGVIEWREGLSYAEIAGVEVDHAALERAVGALLARSHPGVVERHFARAMAGHDPGASAEETAASILAVLEGARAPTFPPQRG